jgi:hypothetical protein
VVSWRDASTEIASLSAGLSDDDLLKLVEDHAPEKVAIDAPFGWPRAFVAAVAAYAASGDWPTDDIAPLRLRDTDRVVIAETRQQPLSVSSDRIAVTAMRCARLLTRLRSAGHAVSRDGAGLVVEVYPAAALRVWGFDPRGYKGNQPEALAKRQTLVDSVLASADWLPAPHERELLVASDHHFDAFVCALLARSVSSGLSRAIQLEDQQAAALEGWIHLPVPHSLGDLRDGRKPL